MGRLLVILLVILLPLRGWSAERMAVQMAQSQVIVEIAGVQASPTVMPADCPMLLKVGTEADKLSPAAKSHVGCQTCQLCMSLAAQAVLTFNVAAPQPQVPLMPINVSFISADLARQAKPPIL